MVAMTMALLGGVGQAQPIFDYVSRPEDAYGWAKTDQTRLASGAIVTHLELTSQVWRGLTWQHRLQLIEPAAMRYPRTALLLITGGSLNSSEISQLATAADMLSAPVVILGDIPNQPLYDGLSEDALIAFTFQNCLESGDPTWPLLFPMTKAAIKAMDAVEAYTQNEWQVGVDSFFVTGASKRGWTTWFVACVAPSRIKGIAPMVYDNLNLAAQMPHQLAAWGDYSEQIDDYTELGLPDMLTSKEGQALAAMVDPYTYRSRATMPKLIISGTNDRYWPVDAANLYFADLPEPRYLLYVPNCGHGLADLARVMMAQTGFFAACTGRAKLPKLRWESVEGRHLKLQVSSDLAPLQVRQWTASAPTRDFREARWSSSDLRPHNGTFTGRVRYPDKGYSAIFAEAVYAIEGRPMPLSTGVAVVGPR